MKKVRVIVLFIICFVCNYKNIYSGQIKNIRSNFQVSSSQTKNTLHPNSVTSILNQIQQGLKSNEFVLQNMLINKKPIVSIIKNVLKETEKIYPHYKKIVPEMDVVMTIGDYIYDLSMKKKLNINTTDLEYGRQLVDDINAATGDAYKNTQKTSSTLLITDYSNPQLAFIKKELHINELLFKNAIAKKESILPLLKKSLVTIASQYPDYKKNVHKIEELKIAISDYIYSLAVSKKIDIDSTDAHYGTLLIDDINKALDETFFNSPPITILKENTEKKQLTTFLEQLFKSNEQVLQNALVNKSTIKPIITKIIDSLIKKYPEYKNIINESEMRTLLGDYIFKNAQQKKIDIERVNYKYGDSLIHEIIDILEQSF